MKNLATALLLAQKDAPAIHKDATNPHYKSRFVSLDTLLGQVVPVLNKHGVVLSQWPTHDNGHPALLTRLTHSESGESMESVMLLLAAKNDPQGQGSAITYARRYALMAALGLSADEDDDGQRASQPSPQARASRAATSEPSRAHASGGTADPPPVAGVELPPDPLARASDEQWREIKQIGLDLGRRIGKDEASVRYAKLLDELRPLNPASLTEAEADRLITALKKEAAQYKVPA